MYYKLLLTLLILWSCTGTEMYLKEIQVTTDNSVNHDLDNNDNFSPDGKWLVYDTRTIIGGIGASPSIERVNIETEETQVLYKVADNHDYGPGVGAVSYHPSENRVLFIHGLPVCSENNPYQQWRRTGVIVNDNQQNIAINMDARDVTFPFTPGALRGGTHRHEWSRDGKWIGYTYNDAIMKKQEDSTGIKCNLRTIAVSNQQYKVEVDKDEAGENVAGTWFSAVVVRVVPNPKPGSDEISNAASDSWIGTSGYKRADGAMQIARAFLGKVCSKDGKFTDELFVVEIPDSIDIPGEYGPLEGTVNTFPMPPKGTVQRRLTYTANSKFPGCSGVVRSSNDGSKIAFLKKDNNGIQQIFIISPLGGESIQITEHISDVQTSFRWSFDQKSIIYIWDNSITLCEISDLPFEKRYKRLTAKSADTPSNLVWSNDGKTIAYNRMVPIEGKNDQIKHIFVIKPYSNK